MNNRTMDNRHTYTRQTSKQTHIHKHKRTQTYTKQTNANTPQYTYIATQHTQTVTQTQHTQTNMVTQTQHNTNTTRQRNKRKKNTHTQTPSNAFCSTNRAIRSLMRRRSKIFGSDPKVIKPRNYHKLPLTITDKPERPVISISTFRVVKSAPF